MFLCFVFCFFYASGNCDMRPGIACKVAGTTRSGVEFLAADSPVSQSRGRALKRRLCQRAVQRQFIRPEQTPSAEASWICSEQKVRSPASRGDVSRVCGSSLGRGGGWQPLNCLLSRVTILLKQISRHAQVIPVIFFFVYPFT